MVDSHATVLHAMSPAFHGLARSLLEKMGVTLVLNDRVVSQSQGKVTLKSGKEIVCDLFIPAHPEGGNCSFMPAGTVDQKNYCKVNDYFQLDNPVGPSAFTTACMTCMTRRITAKCSPLVTGT